MTIFLSNMYLSLVKTQPENEDEKKTFLFTLGWTEFKLHIAKKISALFRMTEFKLHMANIENNFSSTIFTVNRYI